VVNAEPPVLESLTHTAAAGPGSNTTASKICSNPPLASYRERVRESERERERERGGETGEGQSRHIGGRGSRSYLQASACRRPPPGAW
jgi:hypothetical protein